MQIVGFPTWWPISIFKEDNVLSMNASLPYIPQVNAETIIRLLCYLCVVSCAVCFRKMNPVFDYDAEHGSHWYHF